MPIKRIINFVEADVSREDSFSGTPKSNPLYLIDYKHTVKILLFLYLNKGSARIKKLGILPIPIHVKITYKDGSHEEIYKTAEVWKNRQDLFELNVNMNKEIDNIVLSDKIEIPDINRTNNVYIAEN